MLESCSGKKHKEDSILGVFMNYLSGFANHFESEAIKGALPKGQNSPKVPIMGLISEQISGSSFTMDRHHNLRSWFYRIHPSTFHNHYQKYEQKNWCSFVKEPQSTSPARLRWSALKNPKNDCDFIDGVKTMAATFEKPGAVVNHYQLNKSMGDRYFYDADGELLIVPEKGRLELKTEFGILNIEPQEIAVIPRGVKFQINPLDQGWCRGYLCENTGRPLTLPNLGPLGSNALANPRDFKSPTASYEEKNKTCQVIAKFSHGFWLYEQSHSPLDVVAWYGNYVPYKYDLRMFNTMGTVSFDHPDPSIYTVLTSPSFVEGTANLDFVIFPPRWLVGENTFRPPYFHRNVMSEYMGLIFGEYDAKAQGFEMGGASLHNSMSAHGPDTETFNKAIKNSEAPQKISNTMAFMFETCHIFHPTKLAMDLEERQKNYTDCWQNFKPLFGEK
jgi:homogentisate 1,2-dioxygenase